MLVNWIVGGSGAPMTEEEEEVEGMEADDDADEIAEGDAGDADDDNSVGSWFEGPAPLRLRIGILGLMIS